MSEAQNGAAQAGAEQKPAAMPLLYRRPRPLDSKRDAGKSLREAGGYGFARAVNSVVLNGNEFPAALRFYPIVFTATEPRTAVAVLGLADKENLFVGADGAWRAGCYIPAYVRRYPFVMMSQPGSSDLILCVDEASGLLAEGGSGRPLFQEDGKPSKFLQDALAFCSEFQGQHARTAEFAAALAAEGLLVPNEARVALASGKQLTLRGFEVVDEAKFNALPDAVIVYWRKRGWLPLVYCHLLSMQNWASLVELEARQGAAPTAS